MKYITPAELAPTVPVVHPSQRQHHVKPVSAPLYVIAVISNPYRYYTRYKLYQAFEKMCADAGAILYTLELATRNRHFEVTDHNNPHHIQLRSPDVLWHKENLGNIATSRLPADAEYIAFIDADVQFIRPDWAVETVHQLQIFKIVQMWSHSVDLGPDSQPIADCRSLIYSYMQNRNILQPIDRKALKNGNGAGNPGRTGRGSSIFQIRDAYTHPGQPGMLHTGYAWAYRRSSLADLGGLGEIAILGSGDRHMAYALLGEVERSYDHNLHPTYKEYWLQWQRRAERFIDRKIGVVPGTILHYWHGSKQHRRYQDRWKILTAEPKFNWHVDLKKDIQGVWMLTEHNRQLRDDIISYFSVRNEDSSDL